ncbi:MAG: surface carbohydrate biosynthesis protein [Parcubacteria group bacterium]|jgi:surface carbohydrate biosynthesis protein
MRRNKPWLYMPIETKARDLYGKTLLASFAATNNFNVVVGPKKDINSKSLFFPRGIIFNVGLAKNLARNSKKFKREGHQVAVIDEEGLVTLRDDIYLHQRVSREGLENADLFFCWGKRQASIIEEKARKMNCKFFITGNPRFDMLRPEYKDIFNKDIKEIKKKYGKFILVNTNFGRGNHFAGDDFLLDSLKEKGWMGNPDDKKYILANVDWQKKIFKEFQKMILGIAEKFNEYNIIIRPHPSEKYDVWEKIAQTFSNVFVVHSSNAVPWIMAADVLVHNGCTTAVEAFILGTEAISYRPFIIEEQETEFSNKISLEAFSLKELMEMVEKKINNSIIDIEDYSNKKKYLDNFLSGIEGKTASEKISLNLKSIAQINHERINIPLVLLFEIYEYVVLMLKRIVFGKNNSSLSLAYQLHKNPGLVKKDFQDFIKKISKIDKRFANLKVKKIGLSCYQIYERK